MKYELLILAAIVRLEKPVNKAIIAATGISARKLQTTLKSLRDDLGMSIERVNNKRSGALQILDWGVFESGVKLSHLLNKIELNDLPVKTRLIANLSFEEKQQYYDTVKADNFRDSSLLEGIKLDTQETPKNPQHAEQMMAALLARYTKKSANINA
ncbi:MAG: hypothetical protein HRT35_20960 [Algicola sp.]|nr:hypothetical protein [Algicola sp.]